MSVHNTMHWSILELTDLLKTLDKINKASTTLYDMKTLKGKQSKWRDQCGKTEWTNKKLKEPFVVEWLQEKGNV